MARYWSINTAATAVPLSAHPSPFITTKLAAAIGQAVVRRRCSAGPVLPLCMVVAVRKLGAHFMAHTLQQQFSALPQSAA